MNLGMGTTVECLLSTLLYIWFGSVWAGNPNSPRLCPCSEQNCHPFQFSRYMWMHNGVVAGFAQVRAAWRGAARWCLRAVMYLT